MSRGTILSFSVSLDREQVQVWLDGGDAIYATFYMDKRTALRLADDVARIARTCEPARRRRRVKAKT